MSRAIVAAVVVVGIVLPPSLGRTASVEDQIVGGMSGTPVAIVSTIFFTADIYYAGKSRWLPRGWAVAQIIFGSLYTLAGPAMVGLGIWFRIGRSSCRDCEGDPSNAFLGVGSATTMMGIWFLAHGIISLKKLVPPRAVPSPLVSFWPTRKGGIGVLTWTY